MRARMFKTVRESVQRRRRGELTYHRPSSVTPSLANYLELYDDQDRDVEVFISSDTFLQQAA